MLPAAHVDAGHAPDTEVRPEHYGKAASLGGLAVLVVEDQPMIAMDIEQVLRPLGARGVQLGPPVYEALERRADFTPDMAVLGFSPGVQTCEVTADSLRRRGTRFVFATGYPVGFTFPAQFRNVPVVSKPVTAAAVAGAL